MVAAQLIPRRIDCRQQQGGLLFGQPGRRLHYAVFPLTPRHIASDLLLDPQPIRGPKPTDHAGQLGGGRSQRQLRQPLLINHINDPGDLPHLRIRQPTHREQSSNGRHPQQRLGHPNVFPRHPGFIEHDHDSQCAKDLNPVQYRIA